jgi:hypothetical protein
MEANFIKRSQNSGVTTMEIYMGPLVVRPRDRATLSPLLLPLSSARRFSSSSRPLRARPSDPARRSPVAAGVPPPPLVLQSAPPTTSISQRSSSEFSHRCHRHHRPPLICPARPTSASATVVSSPPPWTRTSRTQTSLSHSDLVPHVVRKKMKELGQAMGRHAD